MTQKSQKSKGKRQEPTPESTAPGPAKELAVNAAIRLLAQQGCLVLTLEQVAKEAKLDLDAVKRQLPDTTAVYAAIVERYTSRYYEATFADRVPGRSPEDHVVEVVRRMVEFFRTNIELAIAADVATNQDIPDLHNVSLKAAGKNRDALNDYFRFIGLDVSDPARMAVARGFLTNLLYLHFQSRYVWEHRFPATARTMEKVQKKLLGEGDIKHDDAFYARYAEMVAQMYLHGVEGLARAGKSAEEEIDSTFWLRGLV